ncbi:MAG: type II secretion system F family protein [Microbacteriaceae bacterium]
MTATTTGALAGGLLGTGLWLVWTGWSPARPPLHAVLARLGQPRVEVEPVSRDNLDVRVGVLARRIGVVDQIVAGMRADLRVVRRSPDEQAALLVTYAVLGFLWAPVVAAGGWLVGVRLPVAIPLWFALLGGAIGVFSALRSVKTAAGQRRQAFSHALSSFCDVTGMCLAAGQGVESSLETAAQTGRGWAFVELQTALRTGYVRGDTPWDALARFGNEARLDDLVELAAALSLAGDEGAAVRDTVGSKAKAIRERITSEAERTAASVTERMGIPATLLLLGFIVFLGFPALAVLFE